MDHIKLTVDRLSVEEISELVTDDSCGAISLFIGTTRDNFEGKKVLRLEYEAYESMAIKAIKTICDDVRQKWPLVHGIAIYHRLGNVPCREASVVIAISSPQRKDSLSAVSYTIDQLKASVPIWKKEIYDGQPAQWKENREFPSKSESKNIDKNLVQINVSSEELQKRIQNFIERKREQVNYGNIQDFVPGRRQDEEDTCARVRAQFVKRNDSKGHLKVYKVNNEWGPQTVSFSGVPVGSSDPGLPPSVAERVVAVEKFLNLGPVSKDIFKRLKDMEDRIAYLQSVSPEYAQFWKTKADLEEIKSEDRIDYAFSAEDIARKIDQLEKANL
ncbi:molybdopterin synthase catalytic subunit isoform X1 [Bombyx mori]|uniref:Molybdopterin synthase catalytic subunit n=2 Tax=Bombyx mori TaxID=7091 RepID=A0A8R2CA03_BOMMO|nr:molybdopterin synthase catalytic subunit isoform X1 [Bombyx mori]XP_004923394.2 molybdopterin synthase catalytic subunit isoform X1 [Bombyx mori]XP_012553130.2 molybdopterin synthase catalytic subunit isoform X1 [Bombyx mori]